jgi:hypothetical protein
MASVTTIPTASGSSAPTAVQRTLPVSFHTVQMVVEQGLWSTQNAMRHTAVSTVHPWSATSSSRS